MDGYRSFLSGKQRTAADCGFRTSIDNPHAFDWQRAVVEWACRKGRASLFEDTGLGKTLQQLLWAEAVVKHTNGRVLILCPIAVAGQTVREAEKFGIGVPVNVRSEQSEVTDGITITNYHKLHKFDPSAFAGVVLDEASVLKNFTGKIKRQLLECFKATPYRLTATATPAPNDLLELGNQSDFLGVMPANEMLMRWFINDASEAGNYRIKGHAEKEYWRWVASWSVCATKPSDLGEYSDAGYVLPPLSVTAQIVEDDDTPPPIGSLFHTGKISATDIHGQKRATAAVRARVVAGLVNNSIEPWVVWCDTDYEQDELVKRIECVEVRGSMPERKQEEALASFASGNARVMVTKPRIAGFGLNWQHAHKVAFIGLSYSFEAYFQAVRRCWRFGQTRPVEVHIVASETEAAIGKAVDDKERQHVLMRSAMAEAVRDLQRITLKGPLVLQGYRAVVPVRVPGWLMSKEIAS